MRTNGNGHADVRDAVREWPDGERREVGGARIGQPLFADMSSQQRSATMDRTVAHLNNVTRQLNAVTAQCNKLSQEIINVSNCLTEVVNEHTRRIESTDRHVARFTTIPFMARLRWLVLGR